MAKKFLLIYLVMLLSLQGAVSAKSKGLPEEERIKIAVEIVDSTRHKELDTAQNFELFIGDKLLEKNLLNVIDTKIIGYKAFDEEVTADENSSPENLGELMVFDAVELPTYSETPKNFDVDAYKNLGASYVIRCEVLALGLTKVEDKTLSTIFSVTGGMVSLIGSGSKNRDKTLRRVGLGIGVGGFIQTERTALNTVVNMQFISVETGKILWQENFAGQAVKHHKPRAGYDDAWTQAYMESVENSAKLIAKRVNKYVDRVIIQGKSDKDFTSKNFSISSFGFAKFF